MKNFLSRVGRLKQKSGFTLVECMIGICLFAVMAMLLLQLLAASINQSSRNKQVAASVDGQVNEIASGNVILNPSNTRDLETGWGGLNFLESDGSAAAGVGGAKQGYAVDDPDAYQLTKPQFESDQDFVCLTIDGYSGNPLEPFLCTLKTELNYDLTVPGTYRNNQGIVIIEDDNGGVGDIITWEIYFNYSINDLVSPSHAITRSSITPPLAYILLPPGIQKEHITILPTAPNMYGCSAQILTSNPGGCGGSLTHPDMVHETAVVITGFSKPSALITTPLSPTETNGRAKITISFNNLDNSGTEIYNTSLNNYFGGLSNASMVRLVPFAGASPYGDDNYMLDPASDSVLAPN